MSAVSSSYKRTANLIQGDLISLDVTRLSYFRPRKLEEPVKTTQNNDTVSIDLTMCFLIQGRLGLWGIYRTSSQSITLSPPKKCPT